MKTPIDLYKIGEKLAFNDDRELTHGNRSEAIVTLTAGKNGPPTHIHTKQTEGFEVISGSMYVSINGKEILLKKGEAAIVNAGEAHTFRNGSEKEILVAKAWFEPALHIEWLLQTMGEDAMANGGDWKNVSLLPAMYAMYRMRKEYRIASIPFWVQDILFGMGAFIAFITGTYKKYNLPDTLK